MSLLGRLRTFSQGCLQAPAPSPAKVGSRPSPDTYLPVSSDRFIGIVVTASPKFQWVKPTHCSHRDCTNECLLSWGDRRADRRSEVAMPVRVFGLATTGDQHLTQT
jgi:hypothetical protein